MKAIVDAAQAKDQDAAYEGDLLVVMERAGYAVALQAVAMGAGYGSRVAVLVGPGNNGGDGYVAARHLARRGAAVTVHALADATAPTARAAAEGWIRTGGVVRPIDQRLRADLVVDAVFGVGFHGEVPVALTAWAEIGSPVLAIDVVTGLDASTGEVAAGVLRADRTVVLSNYKLGHFLGSGPDFSGRLVLAELGLPEAQPSMRLCEESDAPRPPRARAAHKWSAGSVAVVGGSAGLAGAAVLAAKAALGFGAGAVATFLPGALAREVDAAHPEIMSHGIGDGTSFAAVEPAELAEALTRYDAVVIGPGLGRGVAGFVGGLLSRIEQPVVLDADGLNAVQVEVLANRRSDTVITPHAAEFTRLAGAAADWQAASALAADADITVLLKGPATVVARGTEVPWLVTSGGRELATVGTGDVLAGMIAALISRGLSPSTAARSAAYWHGEAGASQAAASTVTADTMVDAIRRFAS